ncbi:hypothetical protein QEG98_36040 [Myxococcus sp. MxC21-1]|uniref:hypothetical protein n=1 Tax=Myxococcus sp. MxC21-1 TaxID=3041439 RepID=UPI00292CE637|nr:hypothetical protein [Myxococcus sp. MxC21-1]WNZ61256.1 hypothetical protein QEG98_36040 [Myxococcus sp. MxC21-1]
MHAAPSSSGVSTHVPDATSKRESKQGRSGHGVDRMPRPVRRTDSVSPAPDSSSVPSDGPCPAVKTTSTSVAPPPATLTSDVTTAKGASTDAATVRPTRPVASTVTARRACVPSSTRPKSTTASRGRNP